MKIGDEIEILEQTYNHRRYIKVKIVDIIDKDFYNMYICKNNKSKCTITFTDLDLNNKYSTLPFIKKEDKHDR